MLILVWQSYEDGDLADRGEAAKSEVSDALAIAGRLQCQNYIRSDAFNKSEDMTHRGVKKWLYHQATFLEDADFTLVFAAGHGIASWYLGADYNSHDGGYVRESDILNAVSIGARRGTKKFYFFQHCRGNKQPIAYDDAQPPPHAHNWGNNFQYYATANDFAACRKFKSNVSPWFRAVRDTFQTEFKGSIQSFNDKLNTNWNGTCHQHQELHCEVGADMNWRFGN